MRIKNTAPGGRGFTVGGIGGRSYEWGAGETLDVPDADVKEARRDPVNDIWFTDGTFVPEMAKAAPVVEAKPEPKAKGDAK